MKVAVPSPTIEGESRVALVPETCARLAKKGLEFAVQEGAGALAGFPDADYTSVGAAIVSDVDALYDQADVIALVEFGTF